MNLNELQRVAGRLLDNVGIGGNFSLEPLPGGRNNRVFCVEVAGFHRFLLKTYFQPPEDPRDRMGAEFAFSQFAWEHGVSTLPRPITCDLQSRVAIYEFVSGRRLAKEDVTEEVVRQAIDFALELNRRKHFPEARQLPSASESCFSVAQYLKSVDQRMESLIEVENASEIHEKVGRFIREELSGAWRDVSEGVRVQASKLGIPLDEELPAEERYLSPSDFGFHNALSDSQGRVRFIDFEYAGWDDPAKMICDFFCQPEVPVPIRYFSSFSEAIAFELSNSEKFRQRLGVIFPVCQIKWCCLLLNDFLPFVKQRRRFAGFEGDWEKQAEIQLESAGQILREVALSGALRESVDLD